MKSNKIKIKSTTLLIEQKVGSALSTKYLFFIQYFDTFVVSLKPFCLRSLVHMLQTFWKKSFIGNVMPRVGCQADVLDQGS